VARAWSKGSERRGPDVNRASPTTPRPYLFAGDGAADRDNRPYTAADMVRKRVISKTEFDRIADKVTAM
jgi:hypothetical protein